MIEKTPQEIRAEKDRYHREIKTEQLRECFIAEREFQRLPDAVKSQIKIDLLKSMRYDPNKPIKEQDLLIRVIYYKDKRRLHKSEHVMEFFRSNKERYTDGRNR